MSDSMTSKEQYDYGYEKGLEDLKTFDYRHKWIAQPENALNMHGDPVYLGYFHAVFHIPKDSFGEKQIFKMNTNCQECGLLIKRYTSESDIRLEIFTDTDAGVYPPNLCPCCYNYQKDPSKTRENNPRCQPKNLRL